MIAQNIDEINERLEETITRLKAFKNGLRRAVNTRNTLAATGENLTPAQRTAIVQALDNRFTDFTASAVSLNQAYNATEPIE